MRSILRRLFGSSHIPPGAYPRATGIPNKGFREDIAQGSRPNDIQGGVCSSTGDIGNSFQHILVYPLDTGIPLLSRFQHLHRRYGSLRRSLFPHIRHAQAVHLGLCSILRRPENSEGPVLRRNRWSRQSNSFLPLRSCQTEDASRRRRWRRRSELEGCHKGCLQSERSKGILCRTEHRVSQGHPDEQVSWP